MRKRERKSCNAPPPRVSDPRVLLDDESLDAESRQARREHESVLTSANDQAGRVLVLELELLLAAVQPVFARFVDTVLCSERSLVSGIFLVALDLPKSGEERERLPVAGARRRFLQAEETLAATFGRLVRRVGLEPAGLFVELSVVGLDDFEVLDGGNAVAREVALNLVALDRVEIKVDSLKMHR